MNTRKSRCQRQITLHFNDDTVHILEQFEKLAKSDMMTVESEFLYHLKSLSAGIVDETGSADRDADGLDALLPGETQATGFPVQELPVKE